MPTAGATTSFPAPLNASLIQGQKPPPPRAGGQGCDAASTNSTGKARPQHRQMACYIISKATNNVTRTFSNDAHAWQEPAQEEHSGHQWTSVAHSQVRELRLVQQTRRCGLANGHRCPVQPRDLDPEVLATILLVSVDLQDSLLVQASAIDAIDGAQLVIDFRVPFAVLELAAKVHDVGSMGFAKLPPEALQLGLGSMAVQIILQSMQCDPIFDILLCHLLCLLPCLMR
mmetsp:Transcript_110856/g.357678  ORF Transcript_110856/g.357678 Transcript_110856/m.357678 type:complete len:229 (-) Transcript_110856:1638-2324(-)